MPYPRPVRPRLPVASTQALGLSQTPPAGVPSISVPRDINRGSTNAFEDQVYNRIHITTQTKQVRFANRLAQYEQCRTIRCTVTRTLNL